ncbi:MAG: ATP-binding protein [Chitinivibrionales bacterium]|nr:ATP-binding protein [Chitinivibrionales bacterium]
MIPRLLCIPQSHSIFLFGPRQTGKSTLLKNTLPPQETLYIDLLRVSEYMRYAASPSLFRDEVDACSNSIRYVIVDEIQKIPQLLDEVHSIIESDKPRYFYLSGSSARKIKRSRANLLAGRAWTFNLFPLTHRELKDLFLLERALSAGTLPPVYLSATELEATRTLRSYVDTYLQEEIQAEALSRNIGSFFRFLTYSASCNGELVNYSSIARDCGLTIAVVREYFQILSDTLIGFFLQPFTRSLTKRMVKHPKFYFFDTGVQRAIIGRHTEQIIRNSTDFGRSFEHFIIVETMRLARYSEKEHRFYFYRTSNDVEVDLIVESPDNKLTAIEIKAHTEPIHKHLSGLFHFHREHPDARLFCVCTAPRRRIDGTVTILPWQEIFGELGI